MRNNHLLCKGGGSCISEGAGNSVIITVNTCDTALSNETEIIKAFSPHNDGVNDYLFLSELEAGIDTLWGMPLRFLVITITKMLHGTALINLGKLSEVTLISIYLNQLMSKSRIG
jgi:hypothetical protein